MKSIVVRIFAALVLLILSSCLSGREEFWFERNGSGRLEANYQLPNFAIASLGGEEKLRKIIADSFAKEPSVKLESLSIERRGAQAELSVKVTFASVLKFAKLLEPPADGTKEATLPEPMLKLLGDIDAQRSGASVDFRRRIDPRQVFAGGLFVPSVNQMTGHQLEYIMHLPTAVTATNAHEVSDEGKTVRWKFELADAMKNPVEMNFVAPIPIPRWLWVGLCLCIAAIAWAFRRWRFRKRCAD